MMKLLLLLIVASSCFAIPAVFVMPEMSEENLMSYEDFDKIWPMPSPSKPEKSEDKMESSKADRLSIRTRPPWPMPLPPTTIPQVPEKSDNIQLVLQLLKMIMEHLAKQQNG